LTGQIETYFDKVNGKGLSKDFKDMILKLFSYEGKNRYTVEELKSHPWLNHPSFNKEQVRQQLLNVHAQKSQKSSSPFDKQPVKVKRAAPSGVQ
jgi:serine/threonine protein kinase